MRGLLRMLLGEGEWIYIALVACLTRWIDDRYRVAFQRSQAIPSYPSLLIFMLMPY